MRLPARQPAHRTVGNTPSRPRRARRWMSIGLIVANLLLLVGIGVHYRANAAAIITVTSTDDSGPGSLRQAIADAAPGDTITFNVTGLIALSSGPLTIGTDLTIDGPGIDNLGISGSRAMRVITNNAHLTVSGLTIRDGESGVDNGGGILNSGTLTVHNVLFTLNRGHAGGGIYNQPGSSATVSDSTFLNNLTSLAIDGNGGAIANAAPGATLSVSGTTFNGNQIHDNGSAIYNEASATVVNSTIALNQAGTAAVFSSGDIALNNVTITGNNGRRKSNGLYVISGSSKVENSIIAFNTGGIPDCAGDVTSGGHNLIGNASHCNLVSGEGDLVGNDVAPIFPALGPLVDNGGPTLTMLPQAGSPAIDAGGSTCAATDQRGAPRPANGVCDIGATEAGATAPAAEVPPAPAPTDPAPPAPVDPAAPPAPVVDPAPPAPATPVVSDIAPTTGAEGDTITISGSGFATAADVSFNGTPASFSILGDTQLAAIVPAGALSGPITITTAAGQASSAAFTVAAPLVPIAPTDVPPTPTDVPPTPTDVPPTATPVSPPAISGLAPAQADKGETVTISGSGLSGATGVSFNGVAASSFTVVSDSQIAAVVPAGATTGPIMVTTAAGKASSPTFTSLVVFACTTTVQVPAVANGQTYWFQVTTHTAGPITASWALPAAKSASLSLYADSPFAGQTNPTTKGASGKAIVSQKGTDTAGISLSSGAAQPAGTYTVQFFNGAHDSAAATGTVGYSSQGVACR